MYTVEYSIVVGPCLQIRRMICMNATVEGF
jgi:hypothetical protein